MAPVTTLAPLNQECLCQFREVSKICVFVHNNMFTRSSTHLYSGTTVWAWAPPLSQPCEVDLTNPSRMQCSAPRVSFTNSSMGQVSLGLLMDRVTDLLMINATVTVLPDPSFLMFSDVQEFTQNDNRPLTIQVIIMSCEHHVRSCEYHVRSCEHHVRSCEVMWDHVSIMWDHNVTGITINVSLLIGIW